MSSARSASPWLLAAMAVTWIALATSAKATIHPLSGNARYQTGDGLPVPIGFTPVPNGKVLAVPGAVVSQPPGPDPRAIVFGGGELKHAPVPVVLPVFLGNPNVFQVMTSVGVTVPVGVHTLSAGGRTGAATVQYCAGQVVPPLGNPNCSSPSAGPGINGRMTYTATGAQFGGALSRRVSGHADYALRAGSSAPCSGPTCIFVMALDTPNSTGTGGVGSAFGGLGTSPRPAPVPGLFSGTVTAGGRVLAANPLGQTGLPNPVTSAGGPWTTGRITISVTAALAGPEIFVISGNDSRVSGVGTISLVAGGMSTRTVSGANANRGWLNLVIGSALPAPDPVPSISIPGTAALIGLMSLAGGYAMHRRKRR